MISCLNESKNISFAFFFLFATLNAATFSFYVLFYSSIILFSSLILIVLLFISIFISSNEVYPIELKNSSRCLAYLSLIFSILSTSSSRNLIREKRSLISYPEASKFLFSLVNSDSSSSIRLSSSFSPSTFPFFI